MDPAAPARDVGPAIIDVIRTQWRTGVDGDGAPLPKYSPLYEKQLAALGEPTAVDVQRSGRLLADLKVLRIERTATGIRIVFGVGGGTSPRTPRPPPYVFAGTPEQNAKALARWRAAPKKSSTTETHPALLARLIGGGRGRPARKLLGLPPAARAKIARLIERARIFVNG